MQTYRAAESIRPDEKIRVYSYTAQGTEAEHTHDFMEMAYVISGSGVHAMAGLRAPMSRGDFFFIGIGQSHAFSARPEMRLVNVLLQPQFLGDELLHAENAADFLNLSLFEEFAGALDHTVPHISFAGGEMHDTEALLTAMARESALRQMGYRAALKGYMEVLLTRIFRRMQAVEEPGFLRHIPRLPPEILRYIEANYAEPLTLTELARKSFYTPSYFSTVFREACGRTLTEYIHEKRMQEAVRLLKTTDESVEEIALRVGCRDRKRFYQAFREYTGATPGQLRRSFRKKPTNL